MKEREMSAEQAQVLLYKLIRREKKVMVPLCAAIVQASISQQLVRRPSINLRLNLNLLFMLPTAPQEGSELL